MGRLVHPRGDLQMTIEGIEVESDILCINGKMGVWKAQIFLSPEEVSAMIRSLLKPRLIGYMVRLLLRLPAKGKSSQASS